MVPLFVHEIIKKWFQFSGENRATAPDSYPENGTNWPFLDMSKNFKISGAIYWGWFHFSGDNRVTRNVARFFGKWCQFGAKNRVRFGWHTVVPISVHEMFKICLCGLLLMNLFVPIILSKQCLPYCVLLVLGRETYLSHSQTLKQDNLFLFVFHRIQKVALTSFCTILIILVE